MEVNAQEVIEQLLEQNKQLTLEIAVYRAKLGITAKSNNEEASENS